jgi:hypothetical protein
LRRQHSLGNFFRFLDGKDEAIAILTNYGKKYDKELIKDFWYQDDRRTESATFDLEQAALIGSDISTREKNGQLTPEQFSDKMERIRKAMKTFGEDKERGFETKVSLLPFLLTFCVLDEARADHGLWPFPYRCTYDCCRYARRNSVCLLHNRACKQRQEMLSMSLWLVLA